MRRKEQEAVNLKEGAREYGGGDGRDIPLEHDIDHAGVGVIFKSAQDFSREKMSRPTGRNRNLKTLLTRETGGIKPPGINPREK